MKKIYMQPDTKSVKIELNSLMAGSVGSTSETPAPEGEENTPVNYTRRGGLWDDED